MTDPTPEPNQPCRPCIFAVLPGWEASRGARLEVHVAVELGLQVRSVEGWIAKSVAA